MLRLDRYEKIFKENSSQIAEVEITIVEWKYFVILKEFQKGERRWFNYPTGMKESEYGEKTFIPLTGFRDKEATERFLKAVRVEVDKYIQEEKMRDDRHEANRLNKQSEGHEGNSRLEWINGCPPEWLAPPLNPTDEEIPF